MKRVVCLLLLIMLLSACSYWPPIGDDDNLLYPELPWNHPCNDVNVPQLPGACP